MFLFSNGPSLISLKDFPVNQGLSCNLSAEINNSLINLKVPWEKVNLD